MADPSNSHLSRQGFLEDPLQVPEVAPEPDSSLVCASRARASLQALDVRRALSFGHTTETHLRIFMAVCVHADTNLYIQTVKLDDRFTCYEITKLCCGLIPASG